MNSDPLWKGAVLCTLYQSSDACGYWGCVCVPVRARMCDISDMSYLSGSLGQCQFLTQQSGSPEPFADSTYSSWEMACQPAEGIWAGWC